MATRLHNEIRCSLHGKKVLSVTEYWDYGNKRNSHIWVVLIADPEKLPSTDIVEKYQTRLQAIKAYERHEKRYLMA